jgi:predicted secreted protein
MERPDGLRRRAFAVAILAAVALVVPSCRGFGDVSKSVELTQRDSGKSVDVKVTEVLIITLPANHSTPYHWVLTQAPDPQVLEKIANTYVSSPGPPGTGGHEVWRFRAIGEGGTALQLDYQSLEGTPTGQRFSLGVRVQQA